MTGFVHWNPKTKPITYRVALEVATHEAIVREAYRDSVGVWTWSIGLTNATGHNVKRYINNPQSLIKCLEIYVWALNNYAERVRDVFEGYDLTEAQFAAALSFHWNLGRIHRASWVDLWKQGKISKARKSFLSWNKPPEIRKRRRMEHNLFFDGKWSQNGLIVEYPVTSSSTPWWSRAKQINIEEELKKALQIGPQTGETEVIKELIPEVTKTPEKSSESQETVWWVKLLIGLFKGLRK